MNSPALIVIVVTAILAVIILVRRLKADPLPTHDLDEEGGGDSALTKLLEKQKKTMTEFFSMFSEGEYLKPAILFVGIAIAMAFASPKLYTSWVANNVVFTIFIVIAMIFWLVVSPPKKLGFFYFVLICIVLWGVYGTLSEENQKVVKELVPFSSSKKDVEKEKTDSGLRKKQVPSRIAIMAEPGDKFKRVRFPDEATLIENIQFDCPQGCRLALEHTVKGGSGFCGADGYVIADKSINCTVAKISYGRNSEDYRIQEIFYLAHKEDDLHLPGMREFIIGFAAPNGEEEPVQVFVDMLVSTD